MNQAQFKISGYQILCTLFILVTLFDSLQAYWLTYYTITNNDGLTYTHFNNYIIFKNSFKHLIEHKNLYDYYVNEQADLFKYSPSFAGMMGLFYWLPNWLGLILWNSLNSLVLFWGIQKLPQFTQQQKNGICWVVIIELSTSLQNAQSNALIVALIIWAFINLEKNKNFLPALLLMTAGFIKPFGFVACSLIFLYDNKFKSLFFLLISFILLAILPLLFINYHSYQQQIFNFIHLLKTDHDNSTGYSLMGVMQTWFHLNVDKSLVVLFGIISFLVTMFVRFKKYHYSYYRYLFFAFNLVWIIVFNHKSESPSFIIAMTGIAIWYFIQPRKSWIEISILVLSLLLTSLSATDLVPKWIWYEWIHPYCLKVVPSLLIWLIISYQLVKRNSPNFLSFS